MYFYTYYNSNYIFARAAMEQSEDVGRRRRAVKGYLKVEAVFLGVRDSGYPIVLFFPAGVFRYSFKTGGFKSLKGPQASK